MKQFIREKFLILVVALSSILVVLVLLFAIIGNGVSSKGSIEQLKKRVQKEGKITLSWHPYLHPLDKEKMFIEIDEDNRLVLKTQFEHNDSSEEYMFIARYFPEDQKCEYLIILSDKKSGTDYISHNTSDLLYEYKYRLFGGDSLSTAEGRIVSRDSDLEFKDLSKFLDEAAFYMGQNTKSILPALFIILILADIICLVVVIVFKFVDGKKIVVDQDSEITAPGGES